MARFKILKGETGKHTWKAEGINPKSGRKITLRGGQAGTRVVPGWESIILILKSPLMQGMMQQV